MTISLGDGAQANKVVTRFAVDQNAANRPGITDPQTGCAPQRLAGGQSLRSGRWASLVWTIRMPRERHSSSKYALVQRQSATD